MCLAVTREWFPLWPQNLMLTNKQNSQVQHQKIYKLLIIRGIRDVWFGRLLVRMQVGTKAMQSPQRGDENFDLGPPARCSFTFLFFVACSTQR